MPRGSIKLSKLPERPGVCPECGLTTIEYSSNETDFSNMTVTCPWTCTHCKAEGTEHYAMDFLNHSITAAGDKTKMLDR